MTLINLVCMKSMQSAKTYPETLQALRLSALAHGVQKNATLACCYHIAVRQPPISRHCRLVLRDFATLAHKLSVCLRRSRGSSALTGCQQKSAQVNVVVLVHGYNADCRKLQP